MPSLPALPRTFQDIPVTPRRLAVAMSLWPPYLASGVRVLRIEEDYSGATVSYRTRPWNVNYFGTAYGGTLFSMSDPFWALLLSHRLGRRYVVLDAAAEIDFVAVGRGELRTSFAIEPGLVEALHAEAEDGRKVLHWLTNEVTDASGQVVARVRKQVYVRLRRGA